MKGDSSYANNTFSQCEPDPVAESFPHLWIHWNLLLSINSLVSFSHHFNPIFICVSIYMIRPYIYYGRIFYTNRLQRFLLFIGQKCICDQAKKKCHYLFYGLWFLLSTGGDLSYY